MQDGSYDDGTMAAAYRPDFRVVYLNGAYCWGFEFPEGDCPGEDHPRRWANACSVAFVKAGSNTTTTSTAATTTTITTEAPATTTEAPATTTGAPATTTDAPAATTTAAKEGTIFGKSSKYSKAKASKSSKTHKTPKTPMAKVAKDLTLMVNQLTQSQAKGQGRLSWMRKE